MSQENVRQFFARAAEDRRLQARLQALHRKAKSNRDRERDALIALAGRAGFKITPADLQRMRRAGLGKLTEDQVREVAGQETCVGGRNWFCDGPYICGYSVYHT